MTLNSALADTLRIYGDIDEPTIAVLTDEQAVNILQLRRKGYPLDTILKTLGIKVETVEPMEVKPDLIFFSSNVTPEIRKAAKELAWGEAADSEQKPQIVDEPSKPFTEQEYKAIQKRTRKPRAVKPKAGKRQ